MTSTSRLPAEVARLGPFRATRKRTKVGDLKSRTWRAPYCNGVTPIWAERIAGYWERQERTYGIIYSDHRNAYDEVTGTITTFATVLIILPGERYDPEAVH